MKSIKLFLLAGLLFVTQFAMAVTPAQQSEIDAAVVAASAQPSNQALVDAAIALAASYGANVTDIVTALYNAGIPQPSITNAVAASSYGPPGVQAANAQLQLLAGGPTGTGGAQLGGGLQGGGQQLGFTPATCSGVSKC